MTEDSRAKVLISPAELKSRMNAQSDTVVLVIQSISPYTGKSSRTATRIPGALDAELVADFAGPQTADSGQRPLPRIEDLQASVRRWGITENSTIVVYDNDRSLQAARAWWTLRWGGLGDVRLLDGGLLAWEAANLPLVTETPELPPPSAIVLSGGHLPVLSADDAAEMPSRGVLIDSRIRANYIGGKNAPGQAARGHIPGALNAPAPDNVLDFGNFADPDTLRHIYDALGADGAKPVGVYCGAGVSAAHTVLALASIGVEAAMYPGSWSAWVSDPNRPVVIGTRPR